MKVLFFISCFVLVTAFAAHSQTPTFTFECFCGTLTPADTTCDICNTSTQSRYFKGLLIRKNGVAFKWIEEPYTVIQNFTALTFRELIPNAEQIRIELSGTQWTTIEGFRDSVQCPCAGGGSVTLVPGPGISIYGDTIAVIPQQIDTFDIVGGDTLRISLERDSVPFHFVILPQSPDTSGYNYSFEIDGDSLCVTDGAGTFCVDVSQFLDNTDTSGYNLDFLISNDTLYIRDGAGELFVVLPTPDGSETIVTGANGVQVTGIGTSGTPYVVAPPTGSDTQTLRYSGTTLTANSALTNNGSQVGVNTSPDASYRLKVKQSTDTDGIAVERSSSTSQIRLYHNANGVLETNSNNMHFRSAGNIEMYGAGGGFITQVSVKTINPITVASGNSGVLRIDPVYAPTAAGGDLAFAKIYPDINQTSAANQPLFGVDFNPNLISLQGQLYGFRHLPGVGRFLYQPNGDTVSSHFRGRLGIGSGTTDPVRRLHVVGDMRLTGSVDTPTAVMGRDADGDVANLGLSGLTISAGTLTATDPSPTNEIQRLDTLDIVGNTLRASLLNDGVPFSSVDLSPYVNVGTDLSYSGASSPVTLNSNTGTDVTVTAGTGISLSATSGNMAITNTSPDQTVTITNGGGITVGGSYPAFTLTAADQSATNEIQTVTATGAGPTSYDIELSLSGGAVTLSEGTGINLTRSGNTITVESTVTNTDAQNLTIEGSGPTYDIAISGGTDVTVAGAGIVTLSESPANTLVITATEVDGSVTNELQTLNNTGDATSHTATLSNSGGSLKLKEGTNITLTTDATGLNGEVTISATPTSDGNGIYGDGTTPGSGSDALPPGGSTVTIPGQWQPLVFAIDNASTQVHTALRVTTDFCSDDSFTKYLVGKSPSDSLEIYNFDCGAVIKETGGILEVVTDRELYLNADSINMATVPARTIGAAMLAQDAGGFVRKISGSSVGQILKWNGTNWALATDNTGTGTVDGAENGLNVASNKVRIGGALLTTTTIDLATFPLRHYGGKWSHQQYTGFAYTPTQPLGVSGFENNPTTGGSPTSDGIAEFVATNTSGSPQPNSLTIGAFSTDNTGVWMQARSVAVPNFYYPLALNPNGGNVGVGTSTTAAHSTIQSGGSFAAAYLETVGAPTFDATKHTVAYTANTNISWTLPSAASCACAGRVYILHHVGTAGTITLSQNISKGNGTTFNTLTAGQWAYIVYGTSSIRGYKLASL